MTRRRRRTWRNRRSLLDVQQLEPREVLTGELLAEWTADSLLATHGDGAVVTSWPAASGAVQATGTGSPVLVEQAIGSRPALRFAPSDGSDYFVVADTASPLSGAADFSVVVLFATDATTLVGSGAGQWFESTGLVDSNRVGITADWGLTLNRSGAPAAGMGSGTLGSAKSMTSARAGLNDGIAHVVGLSRQGTTMTLYVDGVAQAQRSDLDGAPRANQSFVIGALTAGQLPYTGDISTVQLYDGALTAAEMAALHQQLVAPQVGADEYFAVPGGTLDVPVSEGLLANDRSFAAGPLAARIVSAPTQGTVLLQADGAFHYQANASFLSGVDQFTYEVADAAGRVAQGTVRLILNSAADQDRIVINELHVNPDVDTELVEFVELHNSGDVSVNLSGWVLADAIGYTFPAGTTIPAGGFLVIAENPEQVEAKFGSTAFGPWQGGLNNSGETVQLYSSTGRLVDEVSYQVGFPWPTVGDAPGYSMELIHPALDNDLGGSWRTSRGQQLLLGDRGEWSYFPGRAEPSADRSWRNVEFPEAGWSRGFTPIGYSTRIGPATPLTDMRNNYSTVYLRNTFTVEDASAIDALLLQALYDDGMNIWINGHLVVSENVSGSELPFTATATNSLSRVTFFDFALPDPQQYLVTGENVIAVQLLNQAIGNSDAYFDMRLLNLSAPPPGPSPGQANSMLATAAPPQVRQVTHEPAQPKAGESVTVTARATDPQGVASLVLQYQVVAPGAYIRLQDGAYNGAWTNLPMHDDGTAGDLVAGDNNYTAILPGTLHQHRHLVRYRLVATDRIGEAITVPYADDPQPNFAYFVYDGVPGWTGANQPGTSDPVTFSAEQMNQLPVYHLIANATDVQNSQYAQTFENTDFFGTLIYDGVVYDHIRFGVRGEFSTYQSGKNKWKFTFNTGHEFQARDDYGNPYTATWTVMNFSNLATPWVTMNRGLAGLDEAVGFRLFELAGVPSPNTSYLQFRVIDDLEEAPANQYQGDLWGLYMSIEHPNGAFLEERDLPEGTTFKVESAAGDIKHQGSNQPNAAADFRTFMNGASRTNTQDWWETNVDLASYFSFRAVNRAINNMDIRDGWNHYLYYNGDTSQWTVVPWDIDMLFVPTTHWSGEIRLQNSLNHDALAIAYRNRVRELQDLLFTPEQIGRLVDEYAAIVNPPTGEMTMVDVDQFMWNNNPRSVNGHRGAFNRQVADYNLFQGPDGNRRIVSADHEGMAQWVKDFMLPAPGGGSTPAGYGANLLNQHAVDAQIPNQPAISYTGPGAFPSDQLRFRSSLFTDPQGGQTFGAMQWRLAEVDDPTAPAFNPAAPPRYEIESTWESERLTEFSADLQLPDGIALPGHAYRIRVRHQDVTGRWSHWSEPVQFVASAGAPTELLENLRISEVHYHPADPTPAEILLGYVDADEFEFIELVNTGAFSLDLSAVTFQQVDTATGVEGVSFSFRDSALQQLAPGERILVVENLDAFAARYGTNLPIAGEWDGGLSNAGETITLAASGVIIQQFRYLDNWHASTDGGGPSLTVVDIAAADLGQWNRAEGWGPSLQAGGSPGRGDALPGDANLDGRFTSSDLVLVFQAGEYEDNVPGNSTFAEGDWDGDGDFTTSDLVIAFSLGNYSPEALPRLRAPLATDILFATPARRRAFWA